MERGGEEGIKEGKQDVEEAKSRWNTKKNKKRLSGVPNERNDWECPKGTNPGQMPAFLGGTDQYEPLGQEEKEEEEEEEEKEEREGAQLAAVCVGHVFGVLHGLRSQRRKKKELEMKVNFKFLSVSVGMARQDCLNFKVLR